MVVVGACAGECRCVTGVAMLLSLCRWGRREGEDD